MSEQPLRNKVAIITGASRGIGKGIALAFADAGADLVLAARSIDDLEKTAEEAERRGVRAIVAKMDAYDIDEVESVIAQTHSQFGRIDILVNNAGGSRNVEGGWLGFLDTSHRALEELFRLNVFSPYVAAQAAARVMKDHGGGVIINITSIFAFYPSAKVQPYSAAKAALQELTKLWAVELGPFQIRVNAIAPGPVESAQIDKIATTQEIRAAIAAGVPLGRIGRPEDIGHLAVFLASDKASWISGAAILAGGGAYYQ
jgi:7-alpha-hydroxysteroid dehydrogenase